jgi:hypothetical protein
VAQGWCNKALKNTTISSDKIKKKIDTPNNNPIEDGPTIPGGSDANVMMQLTNASAQTATDKLRYDFINKKRGSDRAIGYNWHDEQILG